MARPRITSVIAKWLFGESTTSGEKSTLRASLGAAPSSNIQPESIEGTAATITENNIFSGDNTFNGFSYFYQGTEFNASVIFNDAVQAAILRTDSIVIQNSSSSSDFVLFNPSEITEEREQLLCDADGTIPVVPAYPTIYDANESLTAGDFFWDTTLKKLRVATA